jgi:hypothetical protein
MRSIRAFSLVLGVALTGVAPAREACAHSSVSVSFFYDSLAPYGSWVTVSNYGRCWRPAHVSAGWQPYLDGEWAYTDAGWTWVSFDPWGGDPYHYGTWVFTARYGWVWIPGDVWAPAWVTWCITDDYFGWAPVPPSFVVGTSGYIGPAVTVSRSAYVFVPAPQFAGVNVSSVRVPPTQNATLVSRSRPITRFAVQGGVLANSGPAVSQVERVSGRRINRVSLAQAKTQPVPIRTSLTGGRTRAAVVVPAVERAKAIEPSGRHEAQNVNRTQPHDNVKPSGTLHQSPQRPEARERAVAPPPAPPSQPRHERPAQPAPAAQARVAPPRAEAKPIEHRAAPPPQTQVPPHAQVPPQAQVQRPPSVEPRPQGPPPNAHANPPGREKEKEHGKEK